MYIDVGLCGKWDLFGKVKVYLNGKLIDKAVSAKSGFDGFVEFCDSSPKLSRNKSEIVRYKKRGLVKISFNLE